jgi:hypothetical protein
MKPKGQHFFDFYTGAQKMPAGRYTIGIDLERQMITLLMNQANSGCS